MIINNVLNLVWKIYLLKSNMSTTPSCSANRLEWYNMILLSAHTSGMANNAISFSDVVANLNNNESNNMYFQLAFPLCELQSLC